MDKKKKRKRWKKKNASPVSTDSSWKVLAPIGVNTNSASRVTRSEPQCIIMQTARDEELVGKWNRQRVPRPTSIQAQTYCTLGLYVCKREGRTTMRRKKENGENEKSARLKTRWGVQPGTWVVIRPSAVSRPPQYNTHTHTHLKSSASDERCCLIIYAEIRRIFKSWAPSILLLSSSMKEEEGKYIYIESVAVLLVFWIHPPRCAALMKGRRRRRENRLVAVDGHGTDRRRAAAGPRRNHPHRWAPRIEGNWLWTVQGGEEQQTEYGQLHIVHLASLFS